MEIRKAKISDAKGLARLYLQFWENKEKGIRQVKTKVYLSNKAALGLYKKAGFRDISKMVMKEK